MISFPIYVWHFCCTWMKLKASNACIRGKCGRIKGIFWLPHTIFRQRSNLGVAMIENERHLQSYRLRLSFLRRAYSKHPSTNTLRENSWMNTSIPLYSIQAITTATSTLSISHLSTFPPFPTQSNQLPGYSPTFQPACVANCAAARLLTPALQYMTRCTSFAGILTPNRSSKSSSVRNQASGLELIGTLTLLGIRPLDWSSEGSRVSMRRVGAEGFAESSLIWGRSWISTS